MNVDYDLFDGESSTGSVRHTLCRGTMVYDRGEIVTQPGHGRFVRRSLGAPHAGGHVNADRVLEDLRELARLTGGPDGARRVCWTDEWTKARDFLRSRLDELPVGGERRRGGQPVGRDGGGWGRLRDRRLARRTPCPPAAGWTERWACSPRWRHCAARPRPAAAGRAAARRLGRRGGRALRAQPVRLLVLRGHARPGRGARPARPRRRAPGGSGRPLRRGARPRARVGLAAARARARTSSATSSRGPCSSRGASPPPRCSARSGSSATSWCSPARRRTPAPLRCRCGATPSWRPRRRRSRSATSASGTRACARSAARRASPA